MAQMQEGSFNYVQHAVMNNNTVLSLPMVAANPKLLYNVQVEIGS